MHPHETIQAALSLSSEGANQTEIARRLGIPRRTVSDWMRGAIPRSADAAKSCTNHVPGLGPEYAYLLGLYLGDGCISRHRRGVFKLRIFLDAKYPGIIASARHAIAEVKSRRESSQAAELRRGLLVLEMLAVSVPAAWSGEEARAAHRARRLADDRGRPLAGTAAAWPDPLRRMPLPEHRHELVVAAIWLQTGIR